MYSGVLYMLMFMYMSTVGFGISRYLFSPIIVAAG